MAQAIKLSVEPCPKPRMTRSDKWKDRDCVDRYWAFKDEINLAIDSASMEWPEAYHAVFIIPMPKSWTKKKKMEHCGMPCRSKPDRDNLDKALLDALFTDDSGVWDGRATKIWGYKGEIVIISIPPLDGRSLIKELYGSVDYNADL